MQRHEVREARGERVGIGEEVRVLLLQQRDAQRHAAVSTRTQRRRAHRREQGLRHLQRADLAALRFDEHRPRRIEARERGEQRWLSNAFCDGCGSSGQVAEQRAAMAREPLEVEHLRADCRERGEQPALAGAGEPADDDVAKRGGSVASAGDDVAAVGAVAAVELDGAPADLAQHVRERALRWPPRQQ